MKIQKIAGSSKFIKLRVSRRLLKLLYMYSASHSEHEDRTTDEGNRQAPGTSSGSDNDCVTTTRAVFFVVVFDIEIMETAKIKERRRLSAILALVCLACIVVIDIPQFFVTDTNDTANSTATLVQAAKAKQWASVATTTNPGFVLEKVMQQPKMTFEKNVINQAVSVNTTVIAWEGWDALTEFMKLNWGSTRNTFCGVLNKVRSVASNPSLPITANITFGCKDLFQNSCRYWKFHQCTLRNQVGRSGL